MRAGDALRSLLRRCGCLSLFVASLCLAGIPAARAADGFIDLPNVKLWVTDTGGSGDPVILLHANTGTAEAWQKQIPAFAAAGYRVIAIDRPAWGKSVVREGMIEIRGRGTGGEQHQAQAFAAAPFLERPPSGMAHDADLIKVIHSGATEGAVGGWEAGRLDDMGLDA